MPTDVDALLAYGYDLGGPGDWRIHDPLSLEWMNDEDYFNELANERLDAHRHDQDIDLTDVKVIWYGSDTRHSVGIGYILSANGYHSYFSSALTLPLDTPARDSRWDRRLGHALDILRIQPSTAGPRWILAASHGI